MRPISLICQKENEENVKFILDTIINPEVTLIEKEGIILPNGQIIVEIKRTMFDGKMSAILSGAASCQLCTTQFNQLKDLDFIRAGYPINRSISNAKLIFDSVDREDFLSLPSNERFGLTHEPISNIDIISASTLHSYTCIFRWFMLVIYHLQSGTYKWAPASKRIQDSMKFVREFLLEKTGIKIDQASSTGGTTSTGNVARSCFIGKNKFIEWVSTLIPFESRELILLIHLNLSAILRVYNCGQAINTDKLDNICKYTY